MRHESVPFHHTSNKLRFKRGIVGPLLRPRFAPTSARVNGLGFSCRRPGAPFTGDIMCAPEVICASAEFAFPRLTCVGGCDLVTTGRFRPAFGFRVSCFGSSSANPRVCTVSFLAGAGGGFQAGLSWPTDLPALPCDRIFPVWTGDNTGTHRCGILSLPRYLFNHAASPGTCFELSAPKCPSEGEIECPFKEAGG